MKKTAKKKTARSKTAADMRPHSAIMLDGPDRAPSRAMLYPTGFKKADFKKPIIGIASTWSNVTPCNMHIDELARESEAGANKAGGKAIVFNTITISDGISMGTEGMKYSLVSREVIADSIETVVGCECMDGYVAIGGCDKNMPGCMIAIARMNRPAVFVYGGTILPGCITGESKKLDIVSVFEAVGAHSNNKITDKGLEDITSCAIPCPGSCGGMYTANTMASAIEAMGMSLPGSSAQAAISPAKKRDSREAGAAVYNMLKKGIKPRDIMTKKAFENAITVVIALGGSTNAVLHLLAMALAWVAYALPSITDCHMQILVCNIIGMALELSYLAIFFFYADSRERRLKILLHLALGLVPAGIVAAIACIMDGGHHGDGASILGSATIVFAILGFASPLAIVRLVLRTRSVQYMPLSLTLMILVNCGVWLAYGLLDDDAFVTLCNGAGFGFGLLQLGVYCYVCFLLQPLKGEATPLKSKSPA